MRVKFDVSRLFSRLKLRGFLLGRRANVSMLYALAIIPVLGAVGFGVDMTRAIYVQQRLAAMLDAAALAVGAQPGLTQSQAQTLAQNYFNANNTLDSSFGVPQPVTVTISGQSVRVATTSSMPTTIANLIGITAVPVAVSSNVVWGQTKLWVSLVLDNTGSMTQTDSTGLSKLSALQTATDQLLDLLQGAAVSNGDVQVALIPFSKTVNVGTGNVSATWVDWTDWESAPANGVPSTSIGPGSTCPWSTSSQGFRCQANPTNGSSSAGTIPSSGTYKGYICPGVDNGRVNTQRDGRYYNGCYNSVSYTCGHSTCYTHTWIPNAHSTWTGCIMDRNQNYDVNNTPPTSTATNFPAENAQSCVPSVMNGQLNYNWTNLKNAVDNMSAGGSTNQTIGLQWGWMAQSQSAPLGAPTLPSNTSQYIILVSDGLNTQNRWGGDGSNQDSGTDGRMQLACTNAKAQGYIIYTVYIDLAGTQGNSTVLQNCASDASKYFDLTTSGQVISTLNQIGQQITNLHVSQ